MEIENAIGFDNYVEHLPKPVIVEIILVARDLQSGKIPPGNVSFSADALAEIVSTDLLVRHMPMAVLAGLLAATARKFGWVKPPEPPKPEEKPVEGDGAASDIPAELRETIDPPTVPPAAKKDDDESETTFEAVPLSADEAAKVREDAEESEKGASGSEEPVPGAAASTEGSAAEPPKPRPRSHRPPPRELGKPPPIPKKFR